MGQAATYAVIAEPSKKAKVFGKIQRDVHKLRLRLNLDYGPKFEFWKMLYKIDDGIKEIDFLPEESFLEVQAKINAYLEKKRYSYYYDKVNGILFKSKYINCLSGYSFFLELRWYYKLKFICSDTYAYFLRAYEQSPFYNYTDYVDGWYLKENGFLEMFNLCERINKDMKREHYKRYDVQKIKPEIKQCIDDIMDYPDELVIMMPFGENVEDDYEEDIVLQSIRSLRMNIATVEEYDTNYSHSCLHMINDQIGNCMMVHNVKLFVEYHSNGESYYNYHDVKTYQRYYNKFWKWQKTIEKYVNSHKIWKTKD